MELPVVSTPVVVDEINAVGEIHIAIEPEKGKSFLIDTLVMFPDNDDAFRYIREIDKLPTYDEWIEDIVNYYNNQ